MQHIGNGFERASDRISVKINVDKSKVLEVRNDQRANIERGKVNRERMEEAVEFKSLGVLISAYRDRSDS